MSQNSNSCIGNDNARQQECPEQEISTDNSETIDFRSIFEESIRRSCPIQPSEERKLRKDMSKGIVTDNVRRKLEKRRIK